MQAKLRQQQSAIMKNGTFSRVQARADNQRRKTQKKVPAKLKIAAAQLVQCKSVLRLRRNNTLILVSS